MNERPSERPNFWLRAPARSVPLDRIDFADRRFRIGGGDPDPALVESIARAGMLEPALVWERRPGQPLAIVLGWRRLLACRDIGAAAAPCRIAPPEAGALPLLRLAVEDARAGGRLGKLARGRAYRTWRAERPQADAETEFPPLIGAAPRRGLIDSIRRWAAAPEAALQECDRGAVSESDALELAEWSAADVRTILALFRDLRMSASVRREMLEWLPEAARRRGMPLQRAIEAMRAEAANSLNARRPRPAEEAEAFRAVARAWRYPRLSAANARFASILDSIGLPSGCVIEPPAHFEGRAYRFVCSFSDPARLPETLRLAASRLEAGCALRQFVERGE